jgi:hypothetical protein
MKPSDLRIKPQDLTVTAPGPFMQKFAARCQMPLELMVASEELFLSVRSNLRPGDEVTLCRYAPGDYNNVPLLERCEVVVTNVTGDAVEYRIIAPVLSFAGAEPKHKPAAPEPELPRLDVEKNPDGAGYIVKDKDTGHVHKVFKSRQAANNYARDYGREAA